MENEVMYIKLDDIIPNRFQPREVFEEEALNKLADSIRMHGVIEPILVRPVSNKFEIIAGERRYKASVLAGLTKIPAIVRQMDDKESSIVAYIENEHRSNVSAIEEARTIDRILKSNDMTQEELAHELGINQSTLANKLRLLSLPAEIQDSLMHNEISERHARSLLSIKEEEKQIELLRKIKENKMTVRELDSEIKSMNENNYINPNQDINNVTNMESNPMNYINEPSNNIPHFAQPMVNDIYSNIDNSNNEISTSTIDSTSYLNNPFLEPEKQNIGGIYDTTPLNNIDLQPNQPIDSTNDYLNNNLDVLNDNGGDDPSFMNFLNNYDINNPLPENEEKPINDSLTSYDNHYNMPLESNLPNDNNTYLNDVDNFNVVKENNVVINDVNPPITSDFNNSYVENNPNFVDVSQNVVIGSVDEIINKLKVVVDDIKATSKYKIDTDEINYDDIYQITIKIDKRDF